MESLIFFITRKNMKRTKSNYTALMGAIACLFLSSCTTENAANQPQGFEVKFTVGSALERFCDRVANQFNQQNPKLENGKKFHLKCEAMGSGDVVANLVSLAQNLKTGTVKADAPDFPSLISLDGEIYHSQLKYQIEQIFPGQNYIPEITDAPLIANSPMVFITSAELAPGLGKQADIYKSLIPAKTHRDLDSKSSPLPIHFVQTAPTRSNSGLQTLVTQFASVSGKRPEELTVADIQKYQPQVQQIQKKITRYGISTNALAKDLVKNGPYWASVGAVYESSVIAANGEMTNPSNPYEAVYPKATFTSNMRAILPNAPWINGEEKAAAEKVIAYILSPEVQKLAAEEGLRPGVPGVDLGAKFSPQFGVNPNAQYDSLRSPKPEVVAAMLKSWQEFAKKPSQVVLVVDSSGSMSGNKLPAVQNTLQNYIRGLGPKEKIALIDFDSQIRPPVMVDGTPQGQNRGFQFISNLNADGGTRLYEAALAGRDWLLQNLRPDAINAVVILTDGEDSQSQLSLEGLKQELAKTGFSSDKRIAFFTVGYGQEGEFNPQVLQQIAEGNGGYYRRGDPDSISRLMADLQVEF
jgi:Ca-activated chloride channel family protein